MKWARSHSSHVVSVEAEIPREAYASTRFIKGKTILIIEAKSTESVEDAEQAILATVERIIQAVKA